MKKTVTALLAMCFASSLWADEYIYIYASRASADGESARHKLECQQSDCRVQVGKATRTLVLSPGQRDELLRALQAEITRFAVEDVATAGDDSLKLKFKYETPERRVAIERRLAADGPVAVTPLMQGVLKAYLDLDVAGLLQGQPGEGAAGEAASQSGE